MPSNFFLAFLRCHDIPGAFVSFDITATPLLTTLIGNQSLSHAPPRIHVAALGEEPFVVVWRLCLPAPPARIELVRPEAQANGGGGMSCSAFVLSGNALALTSDPDGFRGDCGFANQPRTVKTIKCE